MPPTTTNSTWLWHSRRRSALSSWAIEVWSSLEFQGEIQNLFVFVQTFFRRLTQGAFDQRHVNASFHRLAPPRTGTRRGNVHAVYLRQCHFINHNMNLSGEPRLSIHLSACRLRSDPRELRNCAAIVYVSNGSSRHRPHDFLRRVGHGIARYDCDARIG